MIPGMLCPLLQGEVDERNWLASQQATRYLSALRRHGYPSIFFLYYGFTLIFSIIVAFFLPGTTQKSVKEMEAGFEGWRGITQRMRPALKAFSQPIHSPTLPWRYS